MGRTVYKAFSAEENDTKIIELEIRKYYGIRNSERMVNQIFDE